jgi:hypothetical protein
MGMLGRFRCTDQPGFRATRVSDVSAARDAAPSGQAIVHLWFPGSHPSRRTADAAVGAPGEMAPGRPVPGGDPPEVRRDQTAEPPQFVDARSLKITGRDQPGQNWEALVFGGSNPQQPGNWPQILPGEMEKTGDRAITDLENGLCGHEHVAGLGALQRLGSEGADRQCRGGAADLDGKKREPAREGTVGPALEPPFSDNLVGYALVILREGARPNV